MEIYVIEDTIGFHITTRLERELLSHWMGDWYNKEWIAKPTQRRDITGYDPIYGFEISQRPKKIRKRVKQSNKKDSTASRPTQC